MLMLGESRGLKDHTQGTQAMCGPLPRASPHTPSISHQLQLREEAVSSRFAEPDTPLLHLSSFPDFSSVQWKRLIKW